MVRKVGFGPENKTDGTSITERHVDSFRAKSRQAQELADPTPKPTARIARVAIILFLSTWLIGWSLAIIAVAAVLVSGDSGADWFLILWETLAVLGWGAALLALIRQIRGKPQIGVNSK